MKRNQRFRRIMSIMLCIALIFTSSPNVFAVGVGDFISAADKLLEKTESEIKKDKEVQAVIDKIAAIGEVAFTPECLNAIGQAEAAYSGLSAAQKEQVTNYDVLLRARQEYDILAAKNEDTSALTVVANGTVGSAATVEWVVYSNGLLEIKGSGVVPSFSSSTSKLAPWAAYASSITQIIVRDTITSIGAFAFYNLNNVTSITLPFVGNSRTTTTGSSSAFGYIFGYHTNGSSTYCYHQYSGSDYYSFYVPASLKTVTITDATQIPAGSFYYEDTIKTVKLNEGIKTIGTSAFRNALVLSQCVLPASVETIDGYAFFGTALSEVFIPELITSIKSYTFYGCTKLNRVVLGSNVTTIGSYAFYNTSLSNLVILDKVETIGSYAFAQASSKTTLKSVEFGNGLNSIGESSFEHNSGLTSIEIPNSVQSIGREAFYGCTSLVSITLPFVGYSRTTTSGYTSAFGYIFGYTTSGSSTYCYHQYSGSDYYNFYVPTSLKTVTITDATQIPAGAFYYEDYITTIKLNEGIKTIGDSAFAYCSVLNGFIIPESVTTLGKRTFKNCSALTKIYIPDHITEIPDYCFDNCAKLYDVLLSHNVSKIGNYAFNNCTAIKEIVLPLLLQSIGDYAFYNTSLSKLVIPDKVETIGSYAFAQASSKSTLRSVEFGKILKSLGKYAFRHNTGLTSVEVPNSVQTISDGVFYGCTSLVSITLPFVGYSRTSASGYTSAFGYIFGYTTSGSSTYGYHQYSGYDYYNFYVPNSLKTVTITDATQIPAGAFYYEDYITKINLNDKVATVGNQAFYKVPWYENLKNEFEIVGDNLLIKYNGTSKTLNIPERVKHLGANVFKGHTEITSVTLPENLLSMGYQAFSGCSGLSEMTIPKSVIRIDTNAIPSTCTIKVYCPSAGYDYRSTNRVILNDSFTTGKDTYYYIVKEDSTIEIIGTTTTSTELTIPVEINGITVSSVGDYGFSKCTTLNSITIPANIKTIGKYAFQKCTGLVNATIPATVDSVGDYAFYNCTSLMYVTIAEGVDSLGEGVFYNCVSLQEAAIPDSAVSMGSYAFYNCTSLSDVAIGNSLKAINEYSFYNCEKLSTLVIGTSVESIGDYAFYNCAIARLSIPTTTTIIGKYAFANNTEMTRATLRTQLKTIDDGAFQNCSSLATTSIPANVTYIGAHAYENCTSLPKVIIPVGVTEINDFAFSNCEALADVTINSNATRIGVSAFKNCAFSAITLPTTVIEIADSAFRSCDALYSIVLPDTLTTLGEAAFFDCKALYTVSLPDAVSSVGEDVFYNNHMYQHVYIRYLTGSVANGLLEGQDMRVVVIDNNIHSIGNRAFAECHKLMVITYDHSRGDGEFYLPTNVKHIGDEAFANATNLKNLHVPDTLISVGANAFYNPIVSKYNCKYVTVTFHYAAGSIAANILKGQKVWSITVDDNIHTIGDNAFNAITNLDSVSLPDTIANCGNSVFANSGTKVVAYIRGVDGTVDDSVYNGKTDGLVGMDFDANIKTIGKYAVANSTSLKTVIINNAEKIDDYAFFNDIAINNLSIFGGLKHIGEHAFEECKLVPSLVLPATTEYIGSYAFYNCNSLQTINIPYGVEAINSHTFFGCASLLRVDLPSTVKVIADYAYYGCVLVNYLNLNNSVESIGEYAFYNCNQVTEINLPETLKAIGDYAFRSCSNVTEIIIPDSVTDLGDCVFYACFALKKAEFGSGVTSVGNNVFFGCTYLTEVVFNGDVTYIHDAAFYGAEDATVYAFENAYVENYCYEMCLVYYDLSRNFTMTVTAPSKTQYNEYDELDLTGLALNLTYANGSERTVKTGYTISGYDPAVIGTQSVTVTYKDVSETFEVNVAAKTVSFIKIGAGAPVNSIVGEELDCSSMIVRVTFTDGTSADITDGYTINGYDAEIISEQTVTVTYREGSCEMTITVKDYVRGDTNGDGLVTMKDVTRLVNYLNDDTITVIDKALDVNGDGLVTIKDVTRLTEYLEDNTVEIF